MAGQLVAFTPKKVGRKVEAGKSCATIESGKWVGPAKTAVAGEVAAVNDVMVGNAQYRQQRSLWRRLAGGAEARRLGCGEGRAGARLRSRRAV